MVAERNNNVTMVNGVRNIRYIARNNMFRRKGPRGRNIARLLPPTGYRVHAVYHYEFSITCAEFGSIRLPRDSQVFVDALTLMVFR